MEIAPPQSATVVAQFPRHVPAGARFFIRLGLVDPPGQPDQFAAAAGKLVLFRIDEP